MEKLLSIGKILNFHGIQGELKVGYSENTEHYFTKIEEIYAEKNAKTITLTIEKVRFHKNAALIKFKEINSIDEAIEMKGAILKAPKASIEDFLQEDEFYIEDLVGLVAYDQNNKQLGKVSGVAFSKGQDVLFIKDSDNKEHMIPFAKELVPEVNLKEKKLVIKTIEGLI